MITEDVIKEIYRKFHRPAKRIEDLNLNYFIELLKPYHSIIVENEEIVVEDLDETNPFRRFLLHRISAILEFDKMVAFVLPSHIVFFEKQSEGVHVHFKPVEKTSFWKKLFK